VNIIEKHRPTIRPRSVIDAETTRQGTARDRAARLGWNIDPERSPGNPHAFDTKCADRRCPCHGKTFVHYRRGA